MKITTSYIKLNKAGVYIGYLLYYCKNRYKPYKKELTKL